MNIIVVNGSPNKNGNTAFAVEKYLTAFKKYSATTKYYHLSELNYSDCIDCRSCYATGGCILKDDISPLYQDYNEADILIAASPIYFLSVSAKLKAVIDRTQAIWASKYKLKKSFINRSKQRFGVFIATGGASLSSNINLVARTVVGMYFKSVNTHYSDELIIYNTDKLSLRKNIQKQEHIIDKGKQLLHQSTAKLCL